jgi:hypothetical protein
LTVHLLKHPQHSICVKVKDLGMELRQRLGEGFTSKAKLCPRESPGRQQTRVKRHIVRWYAQVAKIVVCSELLKHIVRPFEFPAVVAQLEHKAAPRKSDAIHHDHPRQALSVHANDNISMPRRMGLVKGRRCLRNQCCHIEARMASSVFNSITVCNSARLISQNEKQPRSALTKGASPVAWGCSVTPHPSLQLRRTRHMH